MGLITTSYSIKEVGLYTVVGEVHPSQSMEQPPFIPYKPTSVLKLTNIIHLYSVSPGNICTCKNAIKYLLLFSY